MKSNNIKDACFYNTCMIRKTIKIGQKTSGRVKAAEHFIKLWKRINFPTSIA